MSPNPNRFAPSPLNEGPIQPKSSHPLRNDHNGEDIKRSTSVDLPSLGQEGMEYASITENSTPSSDQITAPEQTRTIGYDLKLHAPKPSLPPNNAKQRIMAVTRTDSDRAAAFGIGRPSSNDESTHVLPSNRSLKKKASTTSQLSVDLDDEHIPEIGQQVPMLKYAGDVQAPSPAPGAGPDKVKHHSRRTSARGSLPPGSYGLHGHGVFAVDKLEKAYYEKHPEALKKEHTPYQYDRSNDFSMSSENLNKIVRETASRGSGLGVQNYPGTPSEQVGWQAIEESTSRVASPRPISAGRKSPVKPTFAVQDDKGESRALEEDEEPKDVIHVDEPNRRSSRGKSMDGSAPAAEEDEEYTAPILAEDEVAKNPSPYAHEPAVVPERRESAEAKSRPTSRPASIYKENSFEMRSTPLEDVEEYEPLFKDDEQPTKKPEIPLRPKTEHKRRFPSADVWEDAPSSTMYTAEVSTPEPTAEQQEEEGQEEQAKPQIEPREGETFAQAFARQQEELAEKEARENGPDGFVKLSTPKPSAHQQKPSWVQGQPHLLQEVKKEAAKASRPSMAQRFPSRDVWEDTPESLQLQTEVSTPQQDEEQTEEPTAASPEISPGTEIPEPTIDAKLAEKLEVKDETPEPKEPVPTPAAVTERKPSPPAIPARPTLPSRPSIPDRPKPKPAAKPAIPSRPVKASPTSGGLEPAEAAAPPRQKPAVPARPMGSKIAALQAGFMNDLNNRLRLGPQMPVKKEETPAEEEKVEGKEKVPLSDARKGRARGPQRRAPAAKAAATAAAVPAQTETRKDGGPKLSFSVLVNYWSIDPESEESGVTVGTAELKGLKEEKPKEEVKPEAKTETEPEKSKLEEVKDEAKAVAEKPVPEPVEKKTEETKEEKAPEPKSESSASPEAITSEAPGAFPSTPAIEAEVKAEAKEVEAESSVAPDTPTSTEAPTHEQEPVEADAQVEAEPETKDTETKETEEPTTTTAAASETEKVEDKRDATTASEKVEAAAASTPVTNSSNTDAATAAADEAPKEEVKPLVTNTAGETIVQEHVARDDKGGVKPLEAEDKGGEEA